MKNLFKNLIIILTGIFLLFVSYRTVSAQDDDTQESASVNPRTFALGITTLKEHGFGVMARMRFNHFAFDGSVGSLPVIIMYEYTNGTTEVDADMSLHSDIGCVFFINDDQSRFQNGIRLAGVYDSILGPAAMVGWTGELTFNTFALCFGLGIQYYPDFIENVNDNFPDTKSADMDSSQKYQYYLGVNMMWYLF